MCHKVCISPLAHDCKVEHTAYVEASSPQVGMGIINMRELVAVHGAWWLQVRPAKA